MFIGGLQKFTLIDYPGKIAAVVFLAGCNFRCPFCHNPELVEIQNTKTQNFIPLQEISQKDFFKFLKSRQDDLDGVSITGGEPTLSPELFSFIKKIKKLGFLVKVDTNGSNPEMVKKLVDAKLVDYWAMDIKTAPEKYNFAIGNESTGTQNFAPLRKNLEKSVKLISASGAEYEWRTTMAPTVVDKNDIIKIIEWLNKINLNALKNASRYTLNQFRPDRTLDPDFGKLKPYSDDELKKTAELLKPHCRKVIVLG
ncbi:MAG: anaerobic ribonucleoside-triphosphate reductase activating protein [Nitrospiraceae bacterium]|nr:anaerobic ribonucleoside-triphosphate reductase activating protein [Nitrospiraceae bacterium]